MAEINLREAAGETANAVTLEFSKALLKCGVSTTPGSTRSTSSSKARSAGASMSTILEAGDWAHAGVFKKHYYKAVPFDFQTSIFS